MNVAAALANLKKKKKKKKKETNKQKHEPIEKKKTFMIPAGTSCAALASGRWS